MSKLIYGLAIMLSLMIGLASAVHTNATVTCQKADVNQDTRIDSADQAMMDFMMGSKHCNKANNYCNGADINKDKIVNQADQDILNMYLGQECA